MKKLTEARAKELKNMGYTHIAAIMKSVFNTRYYNINSIDAIIKNNGKWIAAYPGMKGLNGTYVDWSCTCRTYLI